jgi:hypothetical protein
MSVTCDWLSCCHFRDICLICFYIKSLIESFKRGPWLCRCILVKLMIFCCRERVAPNMSSLLWDISFLNKGKLDLSFRRLHEWISEYAFLECLEMAWSQVGWVKVSPHQCSKRLHIAAFNKFYNLILPPYMLSRFYWPNYVHFSFYCLYLWKANGMPYNVL